MSAPSAFRRLGGLLSHNVIRQPSIAGRLHASVRPFSSSPRFLEEDKPTDKPVDRPVKADATSPSQQPEPASLLKALYDNHKTESREPLKNGSSGNAMLDLSESLFNTLKEQPNRSNIDTSSITGGQPARAPDAWEPYHFHVYAHRHNTHITVSKPDHSSIISLSCGNLGFKKSRRKNYDSAYQLTAHVLDRLYHDGWHMKINKLEVIFRDFGAGREAATKVLMSPEGKHLRNKIVRVSDSTRLKFGGTRSKKPRRLG